MLTRSSTALKSVGGATTEGPVVKTEAPPGPAAAGSDAKASLFRQSWQALGVLFFLSFLYFRLYRYLIAVYIYYASYEYSILAGPAFKVVHNLSGRFRASLCTEAYTSAATGAALAALPEERLEPVAISFPHH